MPVVAHFLYDFTGERFAINDVNKNDAIEGAGLAGQI
jgi:hypothetical protein